MKACPDCGTIAVETEKTVIGRRVYGCGNRECSLEFYHLNGRIVRYKPLNWRPYNPPPLTERKPEPSRPVVREMASVLSRNGALGCAWLIEWVDGWTLDAGGEDTGRAWKSPDTTFPTAKAAKEAAGVLWRPA